MILLLCVFRKCRQSYTKWLSDLRHGSNVKMRSVKEMLLIWEANEVEDSADIVEDSVAVVMDLEEEEVGKGEDSVVDSNAIKHNPCF